MEAYSNKQQLFSINSKALIHHESLLDLHYNLQWHLCLCCRADETILASELLYLFCYIRTGEIGSAACICLVHTMFYEVQHFSHTC
jgi:hypothetical protein